MDNSENKNSPPKPPRKKRLTKRQKDYLQAVKNIKDGIQEKGSIIIEFK